MKYILSLLLITAMLLTLAACGGKTPYPGTTDPALSATANTQNDPQDALSALRADMKPPVIAVANFHFPELSDNFGIMDYLLDEYPNWMAENDFIRNMPDERVVITCGYEAWANLVCVVPYDPLSTVSVKAVRLAEEGSDGQENVVYRSESGEPILLLAEISDYVTVSVEVVDSEGRGVTWYPYWENAVPIPEDGYSGHLVMDFSPASEKSAYQNALDSGWTVPDASFLTNHYWQSDYGYQLELYYNPGEIYDGNAYIYEDDGTGYYVCAYQGFWRYANGMLHLNMKDYYDDSIVFDADIPILADPFWEGRLGIFRQDDGTGLPQFGDYIEYDELSPISSNIESPYEYALSEGWQIPELWELADSFWLSGCGYALELTDDSVPDDNGGWAAIYDVDEIGAYTQSYSGSWRYEEGMLYLSLIPEFGDGVLVDGSFPVLMLDGQLWIGRNDYGECLPHFYSDMLADILDQPKG